MDRMKSIKEKLLDPALTSGDLESIEKASTIWKTSVEAEKLESDYAQSAARARSEWVRFWIPVLAPLISSAALIATVMFQVYQFQATARASAQASEDNSWRDALRGAQSTSAAQAVFSFGLMRGFLDSERYGNQAREVSVTMLGHSVDPNTFEVLFSDLLRRTTWKSFNDLCRIGASLNRILQSIPEPTDKTPRPTLADITKGNVDPMLIRDNISEEMQTVAKAIADFLRNYQGVGGRTEATLNFSSMQFGTIDLSGVDFSKSMLRNTIFFRCTVNGADFSEVKDYSDSEWEGTAWWRAKSISPGLLEHLQNRFKYEPDKTYQSDDTKDLAEYEDQVRRLIGKDQR